VNQQDWNPDISVTNVEKKVYHAAMIRRQSLNNSSLGYVRGDYVGNISPRLLSKLSAISEFKIRKVNDSSISLGANRTINNLPHYHPNRNKYCIPIQGMMKQRLAILKQDVFKEYEKGMLEVKQSRKELGKSYFIICLYRVYH
jgi:hypothetical protein